MIRIIKPQSYLVWRPVYRTSRKGFKKIQMETKNIEDRYANGKMNIRKTRIQKNYRTRRNGRKLCTKQWKYITLHGTNKELRERPDILQKN